MHPLETSTDGLKRGNSKWVMRKSQHTYIYASTDVCVPCMMGVALMAAEESSSAHFCSRSEERRSDMRCSTAQAACMLLVARAR